MNPTLNPTRTTQMKFVNPLTAIGAALWIAGSLSQAFAGEGHDHGEAPVTTGTALPRFAAVSEAFELVGVVNGKQLTVYLDRFADGSPVQNAKLELELGGIKIPLQSHAAGEFEATLAQELKPGTLAVAATVLAGDESDLLAGELDLHGDAHDEKAAHTHGRAEYALWLGGALALLLTLIWGVRRVRASRTSGDFA
jgi:hypothetical protein